MIKIQVEFSLVVLLGNQYTIEVIFHFHLKMKMKMKMKK